MGYILILIITLTKCAQVLFQKAYVKDTLDVKNSANIFVLISHPLAAVFFLLMAKGYVPLNMPTLIFSAGYAILCFLSITFSLIAYKNLSLVFVVVFSSAGGVIVPFIFETVFRDMDFSVCKLLSIAVRLAAIMVPLFAERSSVKGLGLAMTLFFLSGFATMVPKLYGENPSVMSENSFCFLTNILIIPMLFFIVLKRGNFSAIKADIKKIKVIDFVYIPLGVALSCVENLLTIFTMRLISATVFSVLSSSCLLVAITVFSAIFQKERITGQVALCVALSIGSIILGVF